MDKKKETHRKDEIHRRGDAIHSEGDEARNRGQGITGRLRITQQEETIEGGRCR